jgi:hypothetical protein
MKAMPTDDPVFGKGSIRADGRKLHPMHLLVTKTALHQRAAACGERTPRLVGRNRPDDPEEVPAALALGATAAPSSRR